MTYEQLAGACIAIIGALVVSILAAYIGRPVTISKDSAGSGGIGSGAPQAPISTPPDTKGNPMLEEILAFLAPIVGAGSFGKAADQLVAELQANQSTIVADLDAQGVKLATVVQTDIDKAIAANEHSVVEKVVGPYVAKVVDSLAATAIAAAPSEGAAVFAYIIARIQAFAKSHGG